MDPSGGGIGKAAGDLMKEMEKAQQEVQKQQDPSKTGGASGQFHQAMQAQQANQVQQSQQINQVSQVNKASQVLMQAKINTNLPSTRVGAAAKAKKSKLVDMLQGLIGGQDRMQGIMNMALSGKQLGPSDLIAMQAGVYRFSQELELTSKVIEKATSGIKQTMNTQV